MATYYLCLRADGADRANGLFTENPTGAKTSRYWLKGSKQRFADTYVPQLNSNAHKKADQVGFGIELRNWPNASVDKIYVISAQKRSPAGSGATKATNSSPLTQDAKRLAFIEVNNPGTKTLNKRQYYVAGPYSLVNGNKRGTTSGYEVAVVAIVKEGKTYYQFSYDPEMDVRNG